MGGVGGRSNRSSHQATEILKAFWQHEVSKPFIAFLGLFIVSAVLSPAFLTPYNQRVLALQTAPLALLAFGESMIILMGSIDLSPGSTMALAGTVAAITFVHYKQPLAIAFLAGIAIGALVGFINGLLVTKAKIPSFVATLAALVAGRGMVLILTGGQPIVGLRAFGVLTMDIGPLPTMVWLMFFFTVLNFFLLTYTRWGRYIYAIGGNEEAVRCSGINADLIKLMTFTLAGCYYAIAGLMMDARLEVAYPWTGWGAELDAIASSVLGGIQLTGGVGSPIGPFFGAYVLTLITNVLILMGVNPFYQWVVKGIVLVVAAIALTRGLRYVK
ncbi:MAG: ribose ABC transporter permease [Thermoprotei archaeon]|nr:MAG: ribose ABC transporter permease [Thermoprotei archaeon]